jgi:hypothetical protein
MLGLPGLARTVIVTLLVAGCGDSNTSPADAIANGATANNVDDESNACGAQGPAQEPSWDECTAPEPPSSEEAQTVGARLD